MDRRTSPPTAPVLLGIDVGTSGTKAVLVDEQGQEVALAAVPTPFASRDGRVEMQVEALSSCLRDVLVALGDGRGRVVAVGLAGMAESGAPLDRNGTALAPVIAWHDDRGEEAVARLERHFGPDLALRIGQPVRTVLTVAKLGWLIQHGTTAAVRWLGVPEIGLHALTGSAATEYSLAARTGCYDVGARDWIPEVPEVVGFSVDVFPPVLAAGAVMGRISSDGATWSGLPEGIPATVAGHDHLVGMAGAGVMPREAANSVGTAETVVVRSPTPPDAASALAQGVRLTVQPGGEGWAALFGAARAGLVLEAGAALLGRSLQELDRLAEDAPPVDVGDAVSALAGGGPVTFPDAPAGEVWAGVLHSLTARTAEGYDRLTKVVGPSERLVVFGGGSAGDRWLRAKVAALPVPVVRSSARSAVARGAALYAGVGAGWWSSVAEAPMPAMEVPPSARPEERAQYDE